LQRASDDRLGVPEAVGGGGVDPADSLFEGVVKRGDRLLVFLGSPAEFPASSADRPGAEPDAGDLEAGIAELGGLQLRGLHDAPFKLVSASSSLRAIALQAKES